MTTQQSTAGEPVALSATPDKLPRVAPPHSKKFRAAFAALLGIAIGAIAVAIVVLANNNSESAPKAGHWSAWAPAAQGNTGLEEIASHIGPLYRLNKSAQLDDVTPLPVREMTSSGTTTGSGPLVVVNTGGSVITSQSLELLSGNTVAYDICGLGTAGNCGLAGKPSASRMLLMQREALELALYTLKYDSDSQNVVAVLPPVHTTIGSATNPVTVTVLFDRKELQPLLNEPLSSSLKTPPPAISQLPAWSQSGEANLVNEFTVHGLFSSQLEDQQETGKLLILSPLTS